MKIGAVLPLCISGSYGVDDLGRTEILFKSLTTFMKTDFIDPFLVVCPDHEVSIVQEKLQKWTHLNIEVMSEDVLVPELANYPNMRGWRKQQIVKIAAAQVINRDFYITFDADVICLKPLSIESLIVDGKALLQYEPRAYHPKWWKASARILSMSPNVGDTSVGMHVTPAILSRDLALKLIDELEKSDKYQWADNLCKLHDPKNPRNWSIFRYLKLKWTEYSLYYLCAMKHNLLDKYHVTAGTAENPQLMLIHDSHPFENWNVESSFELTNPGLFCVVGSKSRLEPELVWQTVSPYIDYVEPLQ